MRDELGLSAIQTTRITYPSGDYQAAPASPEFGMDRSGA
jgi:hypothetical protein